MTRDRAIFAIERKQEVTCDLSNGDISNDLDGPLTPNLSHSIFEVEYIKNGVS